MMLELLGQLLAIFIVIITTLFGLYCFIVVLPYIVILILIAIVINVISNLMEKYKQ